MLDQTQKTFNESRESITHKSRAAELLTGTAGVLVAAVVFYLEFFDGAIGF